MPPFCWPWSRLGWPRGDFGGSRGAATARPGQGAPSCPRRGFLIAAFPPGGIPAVLESGAWSSGGLRMKGTTKDEMQPGELCRAPALTGILGQGERKQVLEKPFEFPFLGGLSALASSRDSSSSPCTFLFHPPQSLTPGCLRKPLLQPHASLPEMN